MKLLSRLLVTALALSAASAAPLVAHAALDAGTLKPIKLPEPQLDKSGTLMQALKNRESARDLDLNRDLPQTELSNILWAVDGVNRAEGSKRTAPTGFARLAKQASVVFVMLKTGVYRHDPETHTLLPLMAGDQRKLLGDQEFVAGSPLNVMFALDLDIIDAPGSRRDFEERFGWGNIEIGHKSMAGYLYCAVAGCSAVYRAGAAANQFTELMKQEFPRLRMVGGQTYGYEK